MQPLVGIVLQLEAVFRRLELRHAFGGALANNCWGTVRTTEDVDCLVYVPALQYQRLADELTKAGFVQRAPSGVEIPVSVAAMREQIHARKLIGLYQGGTKAELFTPFLPLQDDILRRAVTLPFESTTIPVTTAEDLILLKMAFHREKDLLDIRGILWVQRGKLDLGYLRSWSGQMLDDKVAEELEELIRNYQEGSLE